ncbi:carboxymuconolactone decarboxylase family protein [Paenibacillus sp.]|uniref:carboxymuconolactone decarboxylase family protein n=1 Tax=Paenibacillus sp. TaxID=58172 RepID=UPI002D758EF0|nr:carboxymuconolactone decarboxylase family protein [Paenibacillus sp.]HZG58722.1 carboxymuconolactone decarboxylase family protein [Paenibacillus sp.]
MKLRVNHYEANPAAYEAMMQLESYIRQSGLDPMLYDLIKLRVSQINGCSFCIDMHGKHLQHEGEAFERILLLTAWREASIYSDKEKAALALAECLTRLPETGVPDDVYERAREHFDEKEYVDLIMAVVTINGWNRLGVGTGMSPGCLLR